MCFFGLVCLFVSLFFFFWECFISSLKKWCVCVCIFKIRFTHILIFVCKETMIHMQLNVEAGSMLHCSIKTAFS